MMRSTVKKIINGFSRFLYAVSIALSILILFSPIAAAERGYSGAIGGEGILAIALFCIAYKLSTLIFDDGEE